MNGKYHPAEVARFVVGRWESSAMKYVNATHWMPLPADPALTSTERCCQKCGSPTKGEEAYVNGQIWCHPCADRGEGK